MPPACALLLLSLGMGLASSSRPAAPKRFEQGAFEALVETPRQNTVHVELRRLSGLAGTKGDAGNKGHNDSVTWKAAVKALRSTEQEGHDLRQLLTTVLKSSPFAAFYWECPPLSRAKWASQTFEFVLIDAPHLQGTADPEPFSEFLDPYKGTPTVRSFWNLGGDSLLVSPAMASDDAAVYTHFGSFIRGAPEKQVDALWQGLGEAIEGRVMDIQPSTPVWVSTEGSGVAWLHLRLDPRPKYYHWRPYRQDPASSGKELL